MPSALPRARQHMGHAADERLCCACPVRVWPGLLSLLRAGPVKSKPEDPHVILRRARRPVNANPMRSLSHTWAFAADSSSIGVGVGQKRYCRLVSVRPDSSTDLLVPHTPGPMRQLVLRGGGRSREQGSERDVWVGTHEEAPQWTDSPGPRTTNTTWIAKRTQLLPKPRTHL